MKNADDVADIMDDQAKEEQNVQLDESDSDSSEDEGDDVHSAFVQLRMPHEGDTEDIAGGLDPDNYDHRHSKEWNMLVEKKALDLENQEQIEINEKKAKKKAIVDAKQKAALAQAKSKRERLVQLEKKTLEHK